MSPSAPKVAKSSAWTRVKGGSPSKKVKAEANVVLDDGVGLSEEAAVINVVLEEIEEADAIQATFRANYEEAATANSAKLAKSKGLKKVSSWLLVPFLMCFCTDIHPFDCCFERRDCS